MIFWVSKGGWFLIYLSIKEKRPKRIECDQENFRKIRSRSRVAELLKARGIFPCPGGFPENGMANGRAVDKRVSIF